MRLPAAPEQLDQVHAMLQAFWAASGDPEDIDSTWRILFETAVIEIAGNVCRHAAVPGGGTMLSIRLSLYEDRADAVLRDNGRVAILPAVQAFPDPLSESGRGLMIARHAMDLVEYSRREGATNEWRLSKRRAL